jgi:hypothetical protein
LKEFKEIKAKGVWENLRSWRFPTDKTLSKISEFSKQNACGYRQIP